MTLAGGPWQDDEGYEGTHVFRKMPRAGGNGFGKIRTVDGGWRTKTITPDDLMDKSTGLLAEMDIRWMTDNRESVRKMIADVQCKWPHKGEVEAGIACGRQ